MARPRPEQLGDIAREILRKHLRPGQTTMRGEVMLERLKRDTRIGSVIEARLYLKALKDQGEIVCAWVERIGPDGLVTLNLRAPAQSPLEAAWRQRSKAFVAGRSDARPDDEMALGDLWPKLGDWPPDMVPRLFAELYDIRTRLEAGECAGLTGYRASASGRLGSSKLLSLLPRAALQAFGIDVGRFPDLPPYVIVAGPQSPEAVILVENPEAFEAAVQAPPDLPVAWVSAYGFGISHIDGTGTRMISALSSPVAPISLIRAGAPPSLDRLLRHPRLFHWGDLDRTGLLIFRSMRSILPQLRLSALYAPMIALLHDGGGHPYAEATGKPKQDHWASDEKALAELLVLCEERAADQEFLTADVIRSLSKWPLERRA